MNSWYEYEISGDEKKLVFVDPSEAKPGTELMLIWQGGSVKITVQG